MEYGWYVQLMNMFRESSRELKSARGLTTCAMMLALQLILDTVTSVYLTPGNKIGFSFLALCLTGQMLGPVPAMINGFLASFLSWVIKPMGTYFPGYDISGLLAGLVYGCAFYKRDVSLGRAALAILTVKLFVHLGLNTLWAQMLEGRAFMVVLPARALKGAVLFPVEVILLMLVLAAARRVRPIEKTLVGSGAPARRRRGKKALIALCCIAVFCIGVWANNVNLPYAGAFAPKLLAHRGLGQTFPGDDLKWDTDTSKIIYPPEHDYIENTLPSMREAFNLGADCVELDIHATKDDQLAVFHDYLLDYRTEATGEVFTHTMDALRALDVGYGYTADGGATWPLRGKGASLMPELREVLAEFPDKDLLIHIKDGGEEGLRAGELLYAYIRDFTPERLARIAVYGDNGAMQLLKQRLPALRVMSMSSLKRGLIDYMLLGWTGYVPGSLRGTELHIPLKYARFLWGWPGKFMQRMDGADTRVMLVQGDGEYSEGFDDMGSLKDVPAAYTGYIWTNRIDRLSGVNQ